MSKKPSGLGRGLGDLLDDNTPTVTKNKSKVIIRTDEKNIAVSNSELFPDVKPKNKSIKSNYR